MLALLKPIVLTFLKSDKFKFFIVDILEKLHDFTVIILSQGRRKMRLNENVTKAHKTKNTVLNLTQLEEKQVCMAKAVKIFHTLSQED